MDTIIYDRITTENFTPASLDGFIRRQEVTHCWRKRDGGWKPLPIAYVEDWDLPERRALAGRILDAVQSGAPAFGAWKDGGLAGFALLLKESFGTAARYVDLGEFYVTAPLRGRGIGRELFRMACAGARELGAERLYISAHSAQESIAAYRKYGCVEAEEVNQILAEKEPCDMQMEFRL